MRHLHHMKFGVLVFAALGVVGFFLPAFTGDPQSSLWAARSSADSQQIWLVLACFALAAGLAGYGLWRGMARWQAFAAIACFAYVLVKFRTGISGSATPLELFTLGSGAKLVAAGAVGGMISGILSALAPDPELVT